MATLTRGTTLRGNSERVNQFEIIILGLSVLAVSIAASGDCLGHTYCGTQQLNVDVCPISFRDVYGAVVTIQKGVNYVSTSTSNTFPLLIT